MDNPEDYEPFVLGNARRQELPDSSYPPQSFDDVKAFLAAAESARVQVEEARQISGANRVPRDFQDPVCPQPHQFELSANLLNTSSGANAVPLPTLNYSFPVDGLPYGGGTNDPTVGLVTAGQVLGLEQPPPDVSWATPRVAGTAGAPLPSLGPLQPSHGPPAYDPFTMSPNDDCVNFMLNTSTGLGSIYSHTSPIIACTGPAYYDSGLGGPPLGGHDYFQPYSSGVPLQGLDVTAFPHQLFDNLQASSAGPLPSDVATRNQQQNFMYAGDSVDAVDAVVPAAEPSGASITFFASVSSLYPASHQSSPETSSLAPAVAAGSSHTTPPSTSYSLATQPNLSNDMSGTQSFVPLPLNNEVALASRYADDVDNGDNDDSSDSCLLAEQPLQQSQQSSPWAAHAGLNLNNNTHNLIKGDPDHPAAQVNFRASRSTTCSPEDIFPTPSNDTPVVPHYSPSVGIDIFEEGTAGNELHISSSSSEGEDDGGGVDPSYPSRLYSQFPSLSPGHKAGKPLANMAGIAGSPSLSNKSPHRSATATSGPSPLTNNHLHHQRHRRTSSSAQTQIPQHPHSQDARRAVTMSPTAGTTATPTATDTATVTIPPNNRGKKRKKLPSEAPQSRQLEFLQANKASAPAGPGSLLAEVADPHPGPPSSQSQQPQKRLTYSAATGTVRISFTEQAPAPTPYDRTPSLPSPEQLSPPAPLSGSTRGRGQRTGARLVTPAAIEYQDQNEDDEYDASPADASVVSPSRPASYSSSISLSPPLSAFSSPNSDIDEDDEVGIAEDDNDNGADNDANYTYPPPPPPPQTKLRTLRARTGSNLPTTTTTTATSTTQRSRRRHILLTFGGAASPGGIPPPPAKNASRAVKDQYLIKAKDAGLGYKEIKELGQFQEAESTLRGRYRTLTKPKRERVRKPVWKRKDDRLLHEAVDIYGRPAAGGAAAAAKVPWKTVAEYIVDNGGSYHFGNATCRKRWDLLVAGCPGGGGGGGEGAGGDGEDGETEDDEDDEVVEGEEEEDVDDDGGVEEGVMIGVGWEGDGEEDEEQEGGVITMTMM